MGTIGCPRNKFYISLILVVFLCQQSFAGVCKEKCPVATQNSKYKFNEGEAYIYDVDSQMSIYLSGSKTQTQLKVVGQAALYYNGNCEYYMSMPKLLFTTSDNTKIPGVKDLQKPVKFILSNDELTPEICGDALENDFSLNVKRAFISLFQSVEGKTYETDVFGVCPTTTVSNTVGDNVVITKTRDLNSCSHREILSDGFIKGVFNEASGIKSTPVLNGDYVMEQKIKAGILDQVTLTEQYIYLPFSTQNTGARAKVVTKLTLNKHTKQDVPASPKSPKEHTLLFNNVKNQATITQDTARTILKNTIESYDSVSKGVGKQSAVLFADLVRALRKVKKDDLIRLYDDVKKGVLKLDKDLSRKVFLDALFRAGSANSIAATSDLLKKEFNEKETRLAYLSFNLAQIVSKDSLVSAGKTLGPNSPREAFMGVGTLVKKFCAENKCTAADVKDIYQKYGNNLGSCKPTARPSEDKMVAVLKGIRNAGKIFDPVTQKIVTCITDGGSTRVRVAALQAAGASSCAKTIQSKILETLKNRSEDSEIRIEAYLALTKCPTPTLANEIKALLDDEPIYQVGSFITSHLSSIRASADPHRESLRRILGNIRPTNRFPSDIRKYSFNREISYAIDSLGLGASIDSNVIYSQKGFLPRSSSFNLTGELFGNVFNVMELNMRQENLEHVMEHYFGPKGELKSTNFQEMFNKALESYNTIVEGTKKRFRRGIARDSADAFTKAIAYQNDVFSDVEVDLSIKLFGTELYFLSLSNEIPSNPKDFISSMFKVLDKNIKEAKDFNQVYENHVLFMDADLVYPSGIGVALKLGVQGAAAGRLEIGGKTDVKQWKKAPAVTFKVVPSFNIDVSGTLLADVFTTQIGLKLEGNLHSSTGSEIDFNLSEDSKKYDFKVRFPFKNQEIITFKTNTLLVQYDVKDGNVEIPLTAEGSKSKNQFSDCFDQFFPLIGISVCPTAEINVGDGPNSLAFPFAGPNVLGVKFEVEKEFTMSGVYDNSKPRHRLMTYTFDTPGSEQTRRTELQLEVAYDSDYFFRIALDNPRKKASAEAGFKQNDKEVAVYAKANNDDQEYLVKVGYNVKGNEARSEYTPTIIIKGPKDSKDNLGGYKFEGKVIAEKKGSKRVYTYDNIKLITPAQGNYFMNGFISSDGNQVDYDIKYLEEATKKTAQVKGSYAYTDKERFLFDMSFLNTFNEQLNGQFKYEYNHKKDSLVRNDLLLVYGKDLASTKNRVHIYQNVEYALDEKDGLKTMNLQIKVEAPILPLLINFEHEYKPNFAKINFDLAMEPHKLNVYSNNKYNTKTKGDYDVEAGYTFDSHNGKMTAVRVVGDKLSDHTYTFVSSCGFEFNLKGKFGNTCAIDNLDADFEAKAILPKKKDTPYVLKCLIKSTKADFKSNANLVEGSKQLATFNAEGKRGDTTEGKFKLDLVDIMSANSEFNSVKGKGKLSTLVVIKKIDRKLKIESDFHIAQPIYDVNTKFFYDFEKDDNKKIEFTTKSNIATDNIDSKNTLMILTEKYTFNLNGKQVGTTSNGNMNSAFEIGLPTGRKVAGSLDRHREYKNDKSNAKLKFEIYDQLPNGNKRSLSFDTNVKDADFKQRFVDMVHKLSYVGFNKKEGTLTATITRGAGDAGSKKTTIGIKMDGTLLPQAILLNVVADEFSDDKADFKANGKYGSHVDFDLFTSYDINMDNQKPTLHDVKLTINIPETNLKTIKIESLSSYKQPEKDGGLYEGTYRGGLTFSGKSLSLDTSVKANEKQGDIKASINLPDNADPINVKLTYNREGDAKDIEKAKIDFEMIYQKTQKIHFTSDSSVSQNEILWKATLDSPMEKAKAIKLDYDWKISGGNKYASLMNLDVDQQKYGYNTIVVLSEISPSVSLELIYPNKVTKIYFDVKKLEDFKYSTKVHIENLINYSLDLNGEAFFKSHENFYLKVDIDSTNVKKAVFEITSKPGGKGIEFKGIKDGKNLISGSADFQVKDDKGKTIIEGTGNVKLYEEDQATTFKFIRNKFDATKDGETGESFVFDGRLGAKNIISELKLTDKNVAFKHTVCEAKKQCVNIDLRSTLQKSEFNDFKHELLISIDLRELGYSHEFGLKADTAKLGYVIDHTVDMHLQSQDKNKYQYSLYLHKNSAGITLTLPARTVALESTYNYPVDNLIGSYDAGVAFYLDKANNPSGKTSLAFIGTLDKAGEHGVKTKGELRMEHPSIKALSISGLTNLDPDNQRMTGRITLDVFQQENKKIIANVAYENTDKSGKGFNVTSEMKIKSKGLQLDIGFDGHSALNFDTRVFSFGSNAMCPTKDYAFGTYVFLNEKVFEMNGKLFNEDIIKISANYDLVKRSASYNSVFKQIGTTPIVITGQVDGLTTASFAMTKDKLIDVKGQFDIGKEASVKVIGDGKALFNGKIALDETQFLATSFKVQEEDIKSFVQTLTTAAKSENEAARKAYADKFEALKTTLTGQFKSLQESFPDFSALKNDYKKQWEKFQSELQADPTIKAIADFFIQAFDGISKILDEVMKVFLEFYQKISAIISDFYKQLEEAFNTKILPILKDLYKQLETLVYNLYEESFSMIGAVFERVAKALKGFEEDFNKISAAMAELFKNVAIYFKEYIQQLEKEIKDLYQLLLSQLQAMPGLDVFKTKIEEFFAQYAVGEQIADLIKELLTTIRDQLPTEESKEFVQKLNDYINAKLMKKEVNDMEAIKGIFESSIKAVRSLFKMLSDIRKDKDVSNWINALPISFDAFKRVSYIWNVKFSPLNCLKEGGCFSLRDIVSWRPYGFQFTELFPPFKFHGHIGDGEHLFTFDGRHITFPGSCNYVLAHDALDKNFTLVANLVNGKMASLTLFDKGDSVEVTKEGIVNLNGAPSELPVHKNDIHVWRRYYSISILTRYGLNVLCSTDLRICHVTVSGFYHGRLRGLLGNGNHEPYDDFTTPTGTVVENDAAFGNAYRTDAKCGEVASIDHKHTTDEMCSQLFGSGSSLRLCYFMINHKNFKEACMHAVSSAKDKKDAACNIATLYASTCRLEHIPAMVPDTCAKCNVDNKVVELGDDFNVQLPQKQADVVIAIDTSVTNMGDLITNTVENLRKEFSSRQIADTRISIIGFNKMDKYTSLYTTKGGLDFSGTFPNTELKTPKIETPIQTGDPKIDNFAMKLFALSMIIKSDIGLDTEAEAIRMAFDYPFRPQASKVILIVKSDSYSGATPAKFASLGFATGFADTQGIFVHYLVPLDDMTIGGAQDAKKVVGLSQKNVFVLSDGRKRPEGSPEFRDKVEFKNHDTIELAIGDRGMIFNLANFDTLETKGRKAFTVTLSAAIADQVSRTEQKMECICTLKHSLFPEQICLAKDTQILPPKKVTARG